MEPLRPRLEGAARRRSRRAAHPTGPIALAVASAAVLLLLARGASRAPCWLAQPAALAGRRAALLGAAGAAAAAALTGQADEAEAFENAVKQIKRAINSPKKRGAQPGDLGLMERRGEEFPALKECGENIPTCFSTTYNEIDVGYHDYRPWQWSGKSAKAALEEVLETVKAYPPGQSGIDGGGWEIKALDDQCIYVQYESLIQGHIDDTEFCVKPGASPEATSGSILVRSSGREGNGYYDYGVNAIRLNWLAANIAKKSGWKTELITGQTHPRYWAQNCQGGDGRKAPFVTRDQFPGFCPPLKVKEAPAFDLASL